MKTASIYNAWGLAFSAFYIKVTMQTNIGAHKQDVKGTIRQQLCAMKIQISERA